MRSMKHAICNVQRKGFEEQFRATAIATFSRVESTSQLYLMTLLCIAI